MGWTLRSPYFLQLPSPTRRGDFSKAKSFSKVFKACPGNKWSQEENMCRVGRKKAGIFSNYLKNIHPWKMINPTVSIVLTMLSLETYRKKNKRLKICLIPIMCLNVFIFFYFHLLNLTSCHPLPFLGGFSSKIVWWWKYFNSFH